MLFGYQVGPPFVHAGYLAPVGEAALGVVLIAMFLGVATVVYHHWRDGGRASSHLGERPEVTSTTSKSSPLAGTRTAPPTGG